MVRTGSFSVSDFKALLVGAMLFAFLLLAFASIMPDLHDDINESNANDNSDNSTAFRDIPGGELIADNVTLFVLLIVLIAGTVALIRTI